MKKLNLILIAIVLSFSVVFVCYGAFVVTLTDLRVENIQIFRGDVDPDSAVETIGMKMSMNYTLYNVGGDAKGMNVEFVLTAQQRTQILNFIKPFVQAQATTDDVTAPAWAQ